MKPVKIFSKFGTLRANNSLTTLKAIIGNIVFALPGGTVELQCPHESVPDATVTWYYRNRVLTGNPNYMFGKVNNALFIPKMSKAVSGKYTCVAQQGKFKMSADSIVRLAGLFWCISFFHQNHFIHI